MKDIISVARACEDYKEGLKNLITRRETVVDFLEECLSAENERYSKESKKLRKDFAVAVNEYCDHKLSPFCTSPKCVYKVCKHCGLEESEWVK